jgi:hypothetical protein
MTPKPGLAARLTPALVGLAEGILIELQLHIHVSDPKVPDGLPEEFTRQQDKIWNC